MLEEYKELTKNDQELLESTLDTNRHEVPPAELEINYSAYPGIERHIRPKNTYPSDSKI